MGGAQYCEHRVHRKREGKKRKGRRNGEEEEIRSIFVSDMTTSHASGKLTNFVCHSTKLEY